MEPEQKDLSAAKAAASERKKKANRKEKDTANTDANEATKHKKKKKKEKRHHPLPPTPEEVEKARKKAIRVLFMHGLESGPKGAKFRMLDQVFTCYAPDMSPLINQMITYQSPYIQAIGISLIFTIAIAVYLIYWSIISQTWAFIAVAIMLLIVEAFLIRYLIQSNVENCIRSCCDLQATEITSFNPDIVVASSFGGGVAVHLLSQEIWKGPTLLLAPAQYAIERKGLLKGKTPFSIPHESTVTIVHGRQDEVIPLDDSSQLTNLATHEQIDLVVVDDDHRLARTLKRARMEELVLQTLNSHARGSSASGVGHSSSDRRDSDAPLLVKAK